jgi:hypothetical protein
MINLLRNVVSGTDQVQAPKPVGAKAECVMVLDVVVDIAVDLDGDGDVNGVAHLF